MTRRFDNYIATNSLQVSGTLSEEGWLEFVAAFFDANTRVFSPVREPGAPEKSRPDISSTA